MRVKGKAGSISRPTKILIFFASNPDISLRTSEVAKKFSIDKNDVYGTMENLVHAGILRTKRLQIEPHLWTLEYLAGDTLLRELGYEVEGRTNGKTVLTTGAPNGIIPHARK